MLAQMALQMAQQSPPGMFNIEELNRTILNAANMPNIEQILPPKKEPQLWTQYLILWQQRKVYQ